MGGPYMRLERILARITDRFVAVSASEGDQISVSGIGAKRIDIVSPAIDCTYWSPRARNEARQLLDINHFSPVVVGVGRLTAQKDPLTFVRMISVIKNSHPGTRGIWVGDGELRGQVEQEIERLDLLNDFDVVGWQEDVRPYIAAANIVVSTAKYESFGYVVPEAMAMGRAAVGTDITGTKDILPKVDLALLFPAGDSEEAARRVAAVIEVPGKADELGIVGRRFVESEFSIDRMASRLAVLYQLAGQ
jgi:glycosyltransferase involved in cell wall biosynthesis